VTYSDQAMPPQVVQSEMASGRNDNPCCAAPAGTENMPESARPRETANEAESRICPSSGSSGRRVGLITLRALLKSEALLRLDGRDYWFCPERDCDVVYFDNAAGSVFRKKDLTVRIGQKEKEGRITLCYCFDVTLADLQDDFATHGKSDRPVFIAAEVGAGHCACEVRNPRGSCCLGDVAKAIMKLGG